MYKLYNLETVGGNIDFQNVRYIRQIDVSTHQRALSGIPKEETAENFVLIHNFIFLLIIISDLGMGCNTSYQRPETVSISNSVLSLLQANDTDACI